MVAVIIETCRAGLEPDALRAAVLPRLRKAVPVDALWWATVDPATLLYTQAYREELPSETGPYFVDNEFLRDDVNKWTEVAGDRSGVRTLAAATDGKLARSPRYRDIFEPLGLADELRAVLRTRGAIWGFMCLHRERGAVFTPQEQGFIHRIAPHLAERPPRTVGAVCRPGRSRGISRPDPARARRLRDWQEPVRGPLVSGAE